MKDTFEKNIKQSLENHEMPYNASAWKAMQAKLDVVKPVSSLPGSGMKWFIGAASVVVIGVVSYFAVTSTNTNPEDNSVNTVVSENQMDDATAATPDVNQDVTENTTEATVQNDAAEPVNPPTNVNTTPKNETRQFDPFRNGTDNGDAGNEGGMGHGSDLGNEVSGKGNNTSIVKPTNETNRSNKRFILPEVSDLCEGDVVTITNENDEALLIEGPEVHVMIPANESRKVRVNASGIHTISARNTSLSNEQKTFFVKEAPYVDFATDADTKFESGLPTTKLETTVPGNEFNWIIGKIRANDRKVDAHFYKAGNHDVTLHVTGLNGCSNSITKTIHIDEKYNLMAVNSFVPEDSDPRNNTFMPFALTQRNVKFTLIIIDPTDGHIVYQTNNANNGWDGIDKMTGQQVSYETAYIWKVVIDNPEMNEDNEYAGNITPLRRR